MTINAILQKIAALANKIRALEAVGPTDLTAVNEAIALKQDILEWVTPTYSEPFTLTDTVIKGLPTATFHEILPVPGANKIIIPQSIVTISDFAGGDYETIDAAGYMAWAYKKGGTEITFSNYLVNDAGASLANLTTFLTEASTLLMWQIATGSNTTGWGNFVEIFMGSRIPATTAANASVGISVSAGDNFTAGHVDNTIKGLIEYKVFDTVAMAFV